jgi:hypothetical protein
MFKNFLKSSNVEADPPYGQNEQKNFFGSSTLSSPFI